MVDDAARAGTGRVVLGAPVRAAEPVVVESGVWAEDEVSAPAGQVVREQAGYEARYCREIHGGDPLARS